MDIINEVSILVFDIFGKIIINKKKHKNDKFKKAISGGDQKLH